MVESVAVHRGHSFYALCGEDAGCLHLLGELKLNEFILNEEEKQQCRKLSKSTERLFFLSKTDFGGTEVIKYSIGIGNAMLVRQSKSKA